MGEVIGASVLLQSIIPVVSDLGLLRSDVLAWGAALIAVLLIPYTVARLPDMVVEDQDKDEEKGD